MKLLLDILLLSACCGGVFTTAIFVLLARLTPPCQNCNGKTEGFCNDPFYGNCKYN